MTVSSLLIWLTSAAHWAGPDGIPTRVGEHALLSLAALVLAAAIALPVGLGLGHIGRGGTFAEVIGNVGRAMPSLAVLGLAVPLAFALGLGLGFWPTLFAMVPLGIAPMLTNSYVAVREVDRSVVEAAKGLGFSARRIFWEIELPLGAPVVIGGIRGAAVAIVATTTLGAVVAGGGLGRFIVDGLALQEYERVLVGAMLVALMAAGAELALDAAQRLVARNAAQGRPPRAGWVRRPW
jgi:osmoprotectant transport system permease protein